MRGRWICKRSRGRALQTLCLVNPFTDIVTALRTSIATLDATTATATTWVLLLRPHR